MTACELSLTNLTRGVTLTASFSMNSLSIETIPIALNRCVNSLRGLE